MGSCARDQFINATVLDIIGMLPSERSRFLLKVKLVGKMLETRGINTENEREILTLYFTDRIGNFFALKSWEQHTINLHRNLQVGHRYRIVLGGGVQGATNGVLIPTTLYGNILEQELGSNF